MHEESPQRTPQAITIDQFAHELRRLRTEAGNPSYAEISVRISRAREAAGVPVERARLARSTVYDVFRQGRRRLDVALVREILGAFELDAEAQERWTAAARTAVPGDTSEADDPRSVADPSAPEDAAEPAAEPDPETEAEPSSEAEPGPGRRGLRYRRGLVLVTCVGVNLVGRFLVALLDLPLHLDMVGTAISAILVGPWWGALVGVTTNGLGALLTGPTSFPFLLVNLSGALVWGYGVRRFGLGRTIPRFFGLNVLCAVVCSCVATPILLLLDPSDVGRQTNGVADNVLALAHVVVVSTFLSNLLISLADKTISGFIALAVVEARSPRHGPLAIDLVRPHLEVRETSRMAPPKEGAGQLG